MKNNKIIIICIIIATITFAIGILIGSEFDGNKEDIVGTYKTATWNGKDAIIALRKDKSCVYINNTRCNWKLSNNSINLNIIEQEYSKSYVEVYLKDDITEIQSEQVNQELFTISELVEKIYFEPEKNMFYIEYISPNAVDDNYNRIIDLKSKYPIKSITKYKGELMNMESQIQIIIVDDGLMYEEHFFERVK